MTLAHPIAFAEDGRLGCHGRHASRLSLRLSSLRFAPSVLLCNRLDLSLPSAREKTIQHFQDAITRVLGYAKSQTLRNLYRRHPLSTHSGLAGKLTASPTGVALFNAEGDPADAEPSAESQAQAARIAFDLRQFHQDFLDAMAIEQTDALQTAGQELFDEIDRSDPWSSPAQETIDFIRARENLLRDVPDEIWLEIKGELAKGLDAGDSIRDLAKRVSAAFDAIDQGRAETIASNETAAAFGFSRNEAMKAAGVKYKKWLHSSIPEVPRPTHLALHGTIIPMDQPFDVGGEPLMYPTDPSGSPGNTINCHCIAVAASAQDFKETA